MKTKYLFGTLALVGCAFCAASCSDDDETLDLFPEGTLTLNMLNEENGKVLLGNSDVYITSGLNFKSEHYPIFDMGKKQGIGDIGMPDFVNMAPEVAVQPGHGYLVCNEREVMDFSESGQKAIAANAQVYRAFVDSWIRDEDGKETGAKVRFLLDKADLDGNLPAWDSCIGTVKWNTSESESERLDLTFPSAAAEDLEVVPLSEDWDAYMAFSQSKNTLSFTITSIWEPKEFTLLIRNKNIYTRVTLLADF